MCRGRNQRATGRRIRTTNNAKMNCPAMSPVILAAQRRFGARSHQVGGAERETECEAAGQLGGAIPVEYDVALQNLDIALQALQR